MQSQGMRCLPGNGWLGERCGAPGISLPVLLTGCGIVVPSDPARECVPPLPLHPGLAAPEHTAFGCSKVPSSCSCCCTLTIVQRVVPKSSIAKLPLLKALWVWPQTSQDFTNFHHPRCCRRETAAPWNCGRKEARAALPTGSSPTSAAKYMQRSERGSVGASRICSPFVASALLKLEREPCLQAKEKIEQCQQPVLGFFLHFSHSPDPDEGVQHEQQASNKSVEQNHQLHPGPVPLHSPHRQAQCLLGAQRSCPGNHSKACTTQARSSFLSHLHKGAHYNKKETVLPLPQTSWKLFGEKKKKMLTLPSCGALQCSVQLWPHWAGKVSACPLSIISGTEGQGNCSLAQFPFPSQLHLMFLSPVCPAKR